MIEGYLSINDVAQKWNISPRRVRGMCQEGRIPGAAKLGREWAIPTSAEKPGDKRVNTGAYRNWRKNEAKENGASHEDEETGTSQYY